MALEGSTGPDPLVKKSDIGDASKNDKGQDVRPHTHWAQIKGYTSHLTAAEPLIKSMHYSIAKMLHGWPNPELDPGHLITEKEFDAAIASAAGASKSTDSIAKESKQS